MSLRECSTVSDDKVNFVTVFNNRTHLDKHIGEQQSDRVGYLAMKEGISGWLVLVESSMSWSGGGSMIELV